MIGKSSVSRLVSTAVEHFGGLHVMVNNAGVSGTMHRRFLDDDLADFHKVMAINVQAVMAGTRDAARHMAEHGGGSIINLTSIGGIQAGGGVMTYRASKAAVPRKKSALAKALEDCVTDRHIEAIVDLRGVKAAAVDHLETGLGVAGLDSGDRLRRAGRSDRRPQGYERAVPHGA